MRRIVRAIWEHINKVPQRWRNKILFWVVAGGISFLVKLIWGPGVLLGALIISFLGWFLYQYGVRQGQFASNLLGNVWDYFRGAIIFALLPAAWPAFKGLVDGDRQGSIIQLLVLALIAAIIFDKFNQLPRSWGALTGNRRVAAGSKRGTRNRRRTSTHRKVR